MHDDDSLAQGLRSFLARCKRRIQGFGLRLVVHAFSLVAADIIGETVKHAVPPFITSEGGIIAFTYVGLVCLFPRGMSLTSQWLLPTGLGMVQVLLLLALGVPWQLTLLWGGLQTWVQRLIQAKGSLGWEWSALPWLLLALYGFFKDTVPSVPTGVCLATLPLLAALGWGVQKAYARFRVEPLQRGRLASSAARLQQLASGSLADPLKAPLRQLSEQSARFAKAAPRMDDDTVALIGEIADLTLQAAHLAGRPNPGEWNTQTGRVFNESARLNEELGVRLLGLTLEQDAQAADASLDGKLRARLTFFRDSAQQLLDKKYQLPPVMHPHVQGLYTATESILECMRSDPADAAPGDKFLSRYLKAAHTVVDEYIRLARDGGGHAKVEQVLAQSRELMARLEKAFVEEHARLLQNDTINLTAELNVLDKLLKMEGK